MHRRRLIALAILALSLPAAACVATLSPTERRQLSQIPVSAYVIDTATTVTSGAAAKASLGGFANALRATFANPDLIPRRDPKGAVVTVRVVDFRIRDDGIATSSEQVATTGGAPIYYGGRKPVGYTPLVTTTAMVGKLEDVTAVLMVDIAPRDTIVAPRSFMLTNKELGQPAARFGLADDKDDKRPIIDRYAEKAAAAVHIGVQMRY